jgi:ribosomal protein S15P/S13E
VETKEKIMSVSQDKKSELIKKHAQSDKDKGSTNIQVAVLSNIL